MGGRDLLLQGTGHGHRRLSHVSGAGGRDTSNWLGKSATGVFFVVCAALVLFPAIPRPWAVRMISAALVLTVAAFFSYLYQFVKGLEKRKSH